MVIAQKGRCPMEGGLKRERPRKRKKNRRCRLHPRTGEQENRYESPTEEENEMIRQGRLRGRAL